MKTTLLVLVLLLTTADACGQTVTDIAAVMDLLAPVPARTWYTAESHAVMAGALPENGMKSEEPAAECAPLDRGFTFRRDTTSVTEEVCIGGKIQRIAHPFSVVLEEGIARIVLMGEHFSVTILGEHARACHYSQPCVRLSGLPDSKTHATIDIYLTH